MLKKPVRTLWSLSIGSILALSCSIAAAQDDTSVRTVKPRPVSSNDEYKPSIGLMLGMVSPEGSYEVGGGWTLEAAYQPYIPFSLGVEVSRQDFESDEAFTDDVSRTSVLARGAYNFAGDSYLGQSYVGFGIGPIWQDGAAFLSFAPLAGFDIPVTSKGGDTITLGAQIRYVAVSADNPDALSLNGSVKYWF